jgi:hypothetical protein
MIALSISSNRVLEKILERARIIDIVQAAYPNLERSSIHPSDHDNIGNKGECGCRSDNDHIFERLGRDVPGFARKSTRGSARPHHSGSKHTQSHRGTYPAFVAF